MVFVSFAHVLSDCLELWSTQFELDLVSSPCTISLALYLGHGYLNRLQDHGSVTADKHKTVDSRVEQISPPTCNFLNQHGGKSSILHFNNGDHIYVWCYAMPAGRVLVYGSTLTHDHHSERRLRTRLCLGDRPASTIRRFDVRLAHNIRVRTIYGCILWLYTMPQ